MAAALSPHLAATLPSLRPPARRPSRAASASLLPPRGTRIALRRSSRHPCPSSRNSGWFENATRKKALLASETDSPNTEVSKQSSTGDTNSSPDGPPVLTILAGIAVFFLLLWVIGSIFTWIAGLVFGAAKS